MPPPTLHRDLLLPLIAIVAAMVAMLALVPLLARGDDGAPDGAHEGKDAPAVMVTLG